MTKTHKAVLSTLGVLCLLFMGSGVAQAQECIAQATGVGMVRAEGITEVVADIVLRCARPAGGSLAFDEIPGMLDIAVELNTPITNKINEMREVTVQNDIDDTPLGYIDGGIDLVGRKLGMNKKPVVVPVGDVLTSDNVIDDEIFQVGKLSVDGRTITWEDVPTGSGEDPPADDVNLGIPNDDYGFNLIIKGIRANASTVGDDEDIVANVMLNGTPVNSSPIKVADVTTGLIVKVDAATGLQCANEDLMATITIQEGFKSGFMPGTSAVAEVPADADDSGFMAGIDAGPAKDSVIVVFSRIPEGVTVMVPGRVPLADDAPATDVNEVIESFELEIDVDSRAGAVGKAVDGMYPVDLSVAGKGAVVYNIFDDMSVATGNEWAKLPITFQWEAEGDMPAIGSSYVDVSFHPTSSEGGDTFETNGAEVPRFLETGDPVMALTIDDCTTTLLFPFVTNQAGYDTGLVITNTSEEAGSCTITYTGAAAPTPLTTQAVAGGAQWIALASAISPGFQGYLTTACGFRDAHGFAFLSNGYPTGPSTAAQGYLAVCMAGKSCE